MGRIGVAITTTMLTLAGCTHTGSHLGAGQARLDDDDAISIGFRDTTIALVEMLKDDGESASYEAEIDLESPIASDDAITLDLRRDRYTIAVVTYDLPPTLVITPIPATISRTSDIVLTWTPVTHDGVSWSTLTSDEVVKPSQTCNVALRMERDRLFVAGAPFDAVTS